MFACFADPGSELAPFRKAQLWKGRVTVPIVPGLHGRCGSSPPGELAGQDGLCSPTPSHPSREEGGRTLRGHERGREEGETRVFVHEGIRPPQPGRPRGHPAASQRVRIRFPSPEHACFPTPGRRKALPHEPDPPRGLPPLFFFFAVTSRRTPPSWPGSAANGTLRAVTSLPDFRRRRPGRAEAGRSRASARALGALRAGRREQVALPDYSTHLSYPGMGGVVRWGGCRGLD